MKNARRFTLRREVKGFFDYLLKIVEHWLTRNPNYVISFYTDLSDPLYPEEKVDIWPLRFIIRIVQFKPDEIIIERVFEHTLKVKAFSFVFVFEPEILMIKVYKLMKKYF